MEKNNILIPISIVVAGVIVAGAFVLTKNSGGGTPDGNNGQNPPTKEIKIKPVSADDHILGNPAAPVILVEFSDLECPFCKTFHSTMHQVMDEYAKDGQVAWVYRHFPLTQLHPKAPKEAEATECAWEQGGNEAWWKYTDALFAATPSNNGLDLELLPKFAEEIGLDTAKFSECLESGRFSKKVTDMLNDAVSAGGTGTPYSVLLIKGQEPIPVSGALPVDQIRAYIEQALTEI